MAVNKLKRRKQASSLALNDVTLRVLSRSETEMVASAGLNVGPHQDSVAVTIIAVVTGAMVTEVFSGTNGPGNPTSGRPPMPPSPEPTV